MYSYLCALQYFIAVHIIKSKYLKSRTFSSVYVDTYSYGPWCERALRNENSTNTFLWQASSLAHPRPPVKQFALRAGGRNCGPDHITVITQRVAPAWVPGGVLPQTSLHLGLESRLVNAAGGGQYPVSIDLIIDISSEGAVLIPGGEGIAKISGLCGWQRE